MSEKAESVLTPVELREPIRLRNILLATDFSSASGAALNYALAIARRYESQLYVAHVIRPDAYQLVPPESAAATLELVRRSAEQSMADLLISGRLRGIPHQVLLEQGELWTVLSKLIQENDIDLVVVGTHGRTGVQRVVLGSVAEQIFRLSDRPVLTVGPNAPDEAPEEVELKSIIFATDFSPTAERALAYALSLAQEHQAHLTLLHVVQDFDGVSDKSIARVREFFTHRLQRLLPPGADLWCEPEFAVWFGTPVEGILEVASTQQAQLIVLGVRSGPVLVGHLPPAKAYRIVCQARCPVLTVRG
jgi:nucleotide-binding universal stress UspA family protein